MLALLSRSTRQHPGQSLSVSFCSAIYLEAQFDKMWRRTSVNKLNLHYWVSESKPAAWPALAEFGMAHSRSTKSRQMGRLPCRMNVALPQTTEPNQNFRSVRGQSNRTFEWIFGKMRHYFFTLAPGSGPFPSTFPKFSLQNLPVLEDACAACAWRRAALSLVSCNAAAPPLAVHRRALTIASRKEGD